MEGKKLSVVLLVATVGLLPIVHAGPRGFGMHDLPDTCNETQVRSCFPPFMKSGVLAPFTSGNDAKFDTAREAVQASPDLKAEVCYTLKTALRCLQAEEFSCYNGSQTATFSTILELDYNVPRATHLMDITMEVCTSGAQSLAGVSLMTVLLLTCVGLL